MGYAREVGRVSVASVLFDVSSVSSVNSLHITTSSSLVFIRYIYFICYIDDIVGFTRFILPVVTPASFATFF